MWKKYGDEFKRNAIRKVLDGQSVRSVSQELGVNESLIHTAVGNERLKIMAAATTAERN